ncbi:MAG: hypothetical protein QOJ64_536 [Acidobacteriota bacterium]|nr:hypothetical protein [Acidobacteriota bacterium]
MILRANNYCKRLSCPSSESLISYRAFGLADGQMVWVAEHLDECDFCGAELQLLTEHAPLEDEECKAVEMPSSLRCLAQSLLTANWLHIESLGETAFEKERLTLTDA